MGMIYSIRIDPPSCTCDPQDESNWEKKETRSPIDGTVEKTEFVCNVCGDFRILTIPFLPIIFEINMSKIEIRKDIGKMSDIMNNLPLNFLALA